MSQVYSLPERYTEGIYDYSTVLSVPIRVYLSFYLKDVGEDLSERVRPIEIPESEPHGWKPDFEDELRNHLENAADEHETTVDSILTGVVDQILGGYDQLSSKEEEYINEWNGLSVKDREEYDELVAITINDLLKEMTRQKEWKAQKMERVGELMTKYTFTHKDAEKLRGEIEFVEQAGLSPGLNKSDLEEREITV